MFGLKKLFTRKKPQQYSAPQPYPPQLLLNSNGNIIDCEKINAQFHGRLLGVNSFVETNCNAFENKVLQELEKILQNPQKLARMLPRVPLVLPRLMKSLRDDKTTAQDIAGLISEDAVLVADVMRLTESPFYKTRNKITSLKHAVVMLGREGIKRLVASAVLKPLLNVKGGFFMQLSSKLLWEHSEKTSYTAYQLTTTDEEQRFYAYLAGLLNNLGFTVGLKILDEIFDSRDAPNSRGFYKAFDRQCRIITLHIAKSWSMPDSIIRAFELQTDPSHHSAGELDVNLYLADHLAKAQMLAQQLTLDPANSSILVNDSACLKCQASLTNLGRANVST